MHRHAPGGYLLLSSALLAGCGSITHIPGPVTTVTARVTVTRVAHERPPPPIPSPTGLASLLASTAAAPACPPGPSSWPALNCAISQLPGYIHHPTTWEVSGRYGHYGATEGTTGHIVINPDTPLPYLFSVAAHEFSLSVIFGDWDHQYPEDTQRMDQLFDHESGYGVEFAADTMARILGASVTFFCDPCDGPRWQDYATQMLAGHRV